MNNKTQFITLLDQVNEKKKTLKDFEVPLTSLKMNNEGFLISKSENDLIEGSRLTDYAQTQLFTKFNMPSRYMKRMLELEPSKVADHFNFWIEQISEDEKIENKNILLRGFEDSNVFTQSNEIKIRGVLSDRYTILDNDEVLEDLVKVVDGIPDFTIESLFINDKKLHIRLSFNDIFEYFGKNAEGKDDIVKCGLDIQNSEVGYSSLVISPITYRLVCTNGLKVWKAEKGLSKRHVHINRHELIGMMRNAMRLGVEKSKELLEGMKESRKMIIEKPYEFIDNTTNTKEFYFTKNQIQTIKSNFDIEPEHNIYGIVNALTRTARDSKNHDTRINLERFASKLMLV